MSTQENPPVTPEQITIFAKKKCKTCFGTGTAKYYRGVGEKAQRYNGVCGCAWQKFCAIPEITRCLMIPDIKDARRRKFPGLEYVNFVWTTKELPPGIPEYEMMYNRLRGQTAGLVMIDELQDMPEPAAVEKGVAL